MGYCVDANASLMGKLDSLSPGVILLYVSPILFGQQSCCSSYCRRIRAEDTTRTAGYLSAYHQLICANNIRARFRYIHKWGYLFIVDVHRCTYTTDMLLCPVGWAPDSMIRVIYSWCHLIPVVWPHFVIVRDIFGILVFDSLGFVIRLLPYLQKRRLALQVLYSIYTRPRGSIIQRSIHHIP
uniref:Uncharacterized protein n=1 Tax=Aegilops tauschii subsp. strangulata TaxID=200361 RepID=A0A452Y6Q9_AEGTS